MPAMTPDKVKKVKLECGCVVKVAERTRPAMSGDGSVDITYVWVCDIVERCAEHEDMPEKLLKRRLSRFLPVD